jgi:hypothetical protein
VEAQPGSTVGVVFKLADLCNLYESRLKQFETNSTFNRTRLKNKLLLKIPELKPFHKGREVLLDLKKMLDQHLFLPVTILMPCILLKQVKLSAEKYSLNKINSLVILIEILSLILFHVV